MNVKKSTLFVDDSMMLCGDCETEIFNSKKGMLHVSFKRLSKYFDTECEPAAQQRARLSATKMDQLN